MKRDMREMIGNKQILNSPPPPYSFVYSILVNDTYAQHFTLAIKFDCLFLTIFQSSHLFVGFISDKLAPPEHMFPKDVLNHYLVHSRA